MKKFFIKYKAKILLTLFFAFLLLILNNNVFATTIENNNWEGAPSYSNVPALELSTTTDSYVTLINNSRSELVVLEPSSSADYLVLYTTNTLENGTCNRFRGYNTSSQKVSNIKIHKSTFNAETNSWSDWTSSTSTFVSAYAPSNSNYIYKSKNNVAVYAQYVGIIGNDVISTGIPMPEGVKITDNIIIIDTYDKVRIFYTDNPANHFEVSSSYSLGCFTSDNTRVPYKIYLLDKNALIFNYSGESSSTNTEANPGIIYSSKNSIIKGQEGYASGDFFHYAPLTEAPKVEEIKAGTLQEIMAQMEKEAVLKEIVMLLPVILSVLVSLIALRKALKMLLAFLRVS